MYINKLVVKHLFSVCRVCFNFTSFTISLLEQVGRFLML
jgi:hypothetical protein